MQQEANEETEEERLGSLFFLPFVELASKMSASSINWGGVRVGAAVCDYI